MKTPNELIAQSKSSNVGVQWSVQATQKCIRNTLHTIQVFLVALNVRLGQTGNNIHVLLRQANLPYTCTAPLTWDC